MIVYGSELAQKRKELLKDKIAKIEGRKPCLNVILIGENPASLSYVKNKGKACDFVGMDFKLHTLDENIDEKSVEDLINQLNNDDNVDGILLQLPVPKHLDQEKLIEMISVEKDVDGLTITNIGRLNSGKNCLAPCTPLGIIELIKSTGIDIEGKKAVVIGRSNLVGFPTAKLLLNENASVTICHSKTKYLNEVCRDADILVAAVGRAKLVDDTFVNHKQVVIDVGTNHVDGKLCGDVDFEKVKDKVAFITPVPKGVGPMTICMLLENTYKAYKERNDHRL